MNVHADDFARFEHAGWERVADKYDSVWSSLTRQFISYLINAAGVSASMSVLDVACGPGYVSAAVKQLGAIPTGIDFSEKMIAIAKQMSPDIAFFQGNAQDLPFGNFSLDRVLINFGLLHVSQPEQACAEACRVLRSRERAARYRRRQVASVMRVSGGRARGIDRRPGARQVACAHHRQAPRAHARKASDTLALCVHFRLLDRWQAYPARMRLGMVGARS